MGRHYDRKQTRVNCLNKTTLISFLTLFQFAIPNHASEIRTYYDTKSNQYELTCGNSFLTLKQKTGTNDISEPIHLSNSCSAFHPSHGMGIWEWANGGFGAKFKDDEIWFPRAELLCEPEPEFVSQCMGPHSNSGPFIVDECSFKIDGEFKINGQCWINISNDGSFDMYDYYSKSPFFTYLLTEDVFTAKGYWNDEEAYRKAYKKMGEMEKNGPCWENERAEICVGKNAEKYLRKARKTAYQKLNWINRKTVIDELGNGMCEVKSTQGLGIRFFTNEDPLFAILDVPTPLIRSDVNTLEGSSNSIKATLMFDDQYMFSTELELFDERVSELGQQVAIIGRPDFGAHIVENLSKYNELKIFLGDLSGNSTSELMRNAQLRYSLKGSSKAIKRSIMNCTR